MYVFEYLNQGRILIFFSQEGWENFSWGASHAIRHSQYFGSGMKWQTNQSAPGGVKQNSSGVKHFLEGVKKNLGGI